MRKYYKNGKLVGGQTKIASAAKPFDKITGEDFNALKRKKAMGGGYIGSAINTEYGGVRLNNPSYAKYYKAMI